MSDAVRTQIGIVEEVTPGTTPATPAFETLRLTGAGMAATKETKVSNEMRPDRRITDRITVGFDTGGDLPWEISYGAIDSMMRGGMQTEWNYAPIRYNNGTADSIITDVSSTDVTILATAGTAANSGVFAVGHLVRTSGFAAAGNNGLRRAGAGTTGTVIKLASGTVDAAPSATARAKAIGFEGASGDITATASGLGSTALDFTTLGLVAGQWLWVGGPVTGQTFATAACRGWCRISVATAISATALPFDIVPTGWTTDAGTSKTIRAYFGDYMREGTTKRSYTVEQQFQDLTVPTYEYYKGQTVGTVELSVQQRDILTGKIAFMGLNVADPSSTRFAGATDVAAATNDVMNASDNVGSILVNGAVLGGNYCTSLSLKVDNTLRRNNAVGSKYSVAVRLGRSVITGNLEMYYDDATILAMIRASTAVGLFFPISDPATGTKAYLFDMPRIKFGDGNPSVPGGDADRMLATDFQALRSPTFGYQLHFQRVEEFNT